MEDFKGWKPDETHFVKTKIWESVAITCLPPILMIGIYCIVNHLTDEGTYAETKFNDNFDFPMVRSTSFQWSLVIINTLHHIKIILSCCQESWIDNCVHLKCLFLKKTWGTNSDLFVFTKVKEEFFKKEKQKRRGEKREKRWSPMLSLSL